MRAMRSPSRLLTAGAVALLAVLIVAVALSHLASSPTAVAPSFLPSPSPVASGGASPTATPSASASVLPSGDTEATLLAIEQQVREIRGLPAPDIGPPQIISRDQLQDELRDKFAHDYPKARQRADNATLHALGLLTGDQDIATLQLRLLGQQVLGYYDETKRRMVVVTDAGLDPNAEITYAHEYTHALQDAAFKLSSLDLNAAGEDDRSLARQSLVEGDASVVMYQWAFAHLTPSELQGIAQTPIPDTGDVPPWMLQQLLFPYLAGSQFVTALGGGLGGDFAAVDRAFRNRPPASTEQVVHPEKYTANERPMRVRAPDPASALGADWRQVSSTTMGEALIQITLEGLGASGDTAAAAAGWGGDRLVVATGPDDGFALTWRLKWDSAADAREFADAYRSLDLPMSHRLVELADDEVLVVQASSEDVLDRVAEGVAGG